MTGFPFRERLARILKRWPSRQLLEKLLTDADEFSSAAACWRKAVQPVVR